MEWLKNDIANQAPGFQEGRKCKMLVSILDDFKTKRVL